MSLTAEPPQLRMTTAEFLALPEDSIYAELERGEVIELTRPTFEHNELVGDLAAEIRAWVRPRRLGRLSHDILVVLDAENDIVYAPDLLFVAREHEHRIHGGKVWGPPDLVVELASPSTVDRDRGSKFQEYYAAGVPWYWLIDPNTFLVEEYQHTPQGYLPTAAVPAGQVFQPRLFPGLELDVQAIASEARRA